MTHRFVCERCGKIHKWDEALNAVTGFETLCVFCRTYEEGMVWLKRRTDLLIQQGKIKDRWEVIEGIHICPVNRGTWNLYHSREDDVYFEQFFGSTSELRMRCKQLAVV